MRESIPRLFDSPGATAQTHQARLQPQAAAAATTVQTLVTAVLAKLQENFSLFVELARLQEEVKQGQVKAQSLTAVEMQRRELANCLAAEKRNTEVCPF